MAKLFLARQTPEDGVAQLVAIKRLHGHLARTTEFVTMFMDEGRIAGRIHHPNVVRVLDLGWIDSAFFMALEFVVGENLADLVNRTPLPFPVCAWIVREAARGLHAAHELRDEEGGLLQVVHRDVSPQNLLIGYDGTVKMTDFGLAKARSNVGTTLVGKVKGRFSYMAPEQLKPNRFGVVDRRADIFALGILLFEASTRQRLFKGRDDLDTTIQVLTKDVLPPAVYVEDFPDGLAQICMRALQRDQASRYQTAEEMQLALDAYLVEHHAPASTLAELMCTVFSEEKARKEQLVRVCLGQGHGTGR